MLSDKEKEMMEYFEEHEDEFTEAIEALDDYTGYLGDDRYYSMCDFDELMSNTCPTDLANMIYFGDFNPNHDYFRFNGYGNLESSDYKDYSIDLDAYAMDEIMENAYHIKEYLSDDIMEIIEEEEEEEEE